MAITGQVSKCKWCDSAELIRPCVRCGYHFCYSHHAIHHGFTTMQWICLECQEKERIPVIIDMTGIMDEKIIVVRSKTSYRHVSNY